jgi:anti-sigma regulatory factor (Ser/Thr protein kinase)
MRVTNVAAARRFTRALLDEWDVTATEDVALVVTELAANAVRHAGGDEFAVALRLEPPVVVVEVSDSNADEPRIMQPTEGDSSGRGMLIVERLSTRWGSRRDASGKTVWAEIAVG